MRSQSSKRQVYKLMNPTLDPPSYLCTKNIPERDRIATPRLRLVSHSLKIETGRWARIPRDNRLCTCGPSVQDEKHVLLTCPHTDALRAQSSLDFTSLETIMNAEPKPLAKFCREALSIVGNSMCLCDYIFMNIKPNSLNHFILQCNFRHCQLTDITLILLFYCLL